MQITDAVFALQEQKEVAVAVVKRRTFGVMEEHRRASHDTLGRSETIARLFDGDAGAIAGLARDRRQAPNPARELWLAVIQQAVAELRTYAQSTRAWQQTYDWLNSRDFNLVCEFAGVPADTVAKIAMAPIKAAPVKGRRLAPKPVICIETGERYPSAYRCAREVGVSSGSIIGAIQRGCRIRGLHYRYEETRDVAA